jgi:GAF domain-containing protein
MAISQTQKIHQPSRLAQLWQKIVRAHPSITAGSARKQAELISSFLFAFTLLASVRVIFAIRSGSIYTDPTIPAFLVLVLSIGATYAFSRTRYFLWAGAVALLALSTSIWVIIIVSKEYTPFDVLGPAMWLLASVLLGGLLFPWWGGLLWSIINIVPVFVMPNLIPGLEASSLTTVYSMMIVFTGLILVLNRNRDLQEQERRIELLEANRELEELSHSLEDRVAAATQELELAAEVGQRLSLVQDPDTMLAEAVNLIRDRFELYYTQIYLIDPAGQSLVLRAGTGDVGQTLLGRSHRLPIDLGSLNGTAVVERRAVIVENTETSIIHRPNPQLPDTRSEMVIPLIAADRVLGVLDMQSAQGGALSADNLAAFEVLAGQLTITILNAELFIEAERARLSVEQQARRLTREGWNDFLNAVDIPDRIAYSYDQGEVAETAEPFSGGIGGSALVSPIQVSGEPIGSFELNRVSDWTEDDHLMVNAIATQVGQQIENLRLLGQAERFQAETQAALRRLTREGWEDYQGQEGLSDLGFVYKAHEVQSLSANPDQFDDEFTYDIQVRDVPIGQFAIDASAALSDEDVELLASVTDQLSSHLESLRLTHQTEQALAITEEQAERLAALNNLSEQLAQAENLDEIYKVSSVLLNEVIEADRASMTRLSADGMLEVFSLQGAAGAIPTGAKLPVEGTAVGTAVISRQPVLVSDLTTSEFKENAQLAKQGLRSTLAVPLIVGGQPIGTINFGSVERNKYSDRERDLAVQAASLMAATIENRGLIQATQHRAEREQALREITAAVRASTDPVTILRTAVRELGTAMGRRAVIRMATGYQSDGDNNNS